MVVQQKAKKSRSSLPAGESFLGSPAFSHEGVPLWNLEENKSKRSWPCMIGSRVTNKYFACSGMPERVRQL